MNVTLYITPAENQPGNYLLVVNGDGFYNSVNKKVGARIRGDDEWFDDTLFVIVADHCAAVAGKSKLPVNGYRIPLIFYAPKLVAPAVGRSAISASSSFVLPRRFSVSSSS